MVRNKFIPYIDVGLGPTLEAQCIEKLACIIRSSNYILGKEVATLERAVADFLGAKYAVALNSGFSALFIALRALNIGPGDEVITVSNTFVATVNAIQLVGAKAVFCDVGADRNLNPDLLDRAISSRTKAIIPVHLAGIPAQMDPVINFANKYGLYVIEDAAQAFGAKYNNKYVSTIGDIGCFSFYPTKPLGACGDGGLLVTNNREIYEKATLFRNHGLHDRDHCATWGYNFRLDEFQAGILNVKLHYLDEWNKKRREIASQYNKGLANTHLELPVVKDNLTPVFFSYVVQTDLRDELQEYLLSQGIESKIHYPICVHQQSAYAKQCFDSRLLITEQQNSRILSLPIYPSLSKENIEYITNCIIAFDKM